MNTLSNSQFIRKKPQIETIFTLETKTNLSNPREDLQGNLYVCSDSGEIIKFNDDGENETYLTLGGIPKSISFSSSSLYIADIANSVIYEKKSDNEDINLLFKDYCESPLKGPTSIINIEENENINYIITSDAGYFGTSSLNNPKGSIFIYDLNNGILRPILLNCLAHPSDIYYDSLNGILYICEMLNNRIIRVIQNPKGIFHSSVFYTFNGKIGPSAITMDEIGNIYVARYEFYDKNKKDNNGIISMLNKEGMLIGEIIVDDSCEINGLLIPKLHKIQDNDTNSNNNNLNGSHNGSNSISHLSNNCLYFTDKNFSGVKRIKLSQLAQEDEKNENKY